MWFVYALYNSLVNKIYIGETSDLDRRITEHNQKRGHHYTAKFEGQWQVVYKEEVQDRKAALKREKQLKSHSGRDFIRKLI